MPKTNAKPTGPNSTEKPENTSLLLMSQQSSPPALPVDYEPIRQRLTEVVEMTIADLAAQPMSIQLKMMLNGSTSLLRMGIQKEEARKLHLLMTCLAGIAGAVSDLDSCQLDYEKQV